MSVKIFKIILKVMVHMVQHTVQVPTELSKVQVPTGNNMVLTTSMAVRSRIKTSRIKTSSYKTQASRI